MFRLTDFSRFTHPQLFAMLHAGNPATIRAAAQTWDTVGARLHEQAGNLEKRLLTFRHQWQGGAADQYNAMIADLYGGLRAVANVAFTMRDLTHDSADALTRAQAEMPRPVNVPDLPSELIRLATMPVAVDPAASAAVLARLHQQQTDAVAAVRAQQHAAQASNAAHAKAIAVMSELAARYHTALVAIPHSAGGRAGEAVGWGIGRPAGGSATSPPLFGNMFNAGLAAASAAAAGRFGLGLPLVPPWAKKPDPAAEPAKPEVAEPAALDAFGGGLGGGGGIGGGIGGGLGGLGAGVAPAAHASLAGGAAPAAIAASGFGAAAGGAGGLGTGMPMTPMMPMMPMGGMGGADAAGARRVPPWLVETEDVWGESSAISPSVIGEDRATGPDPARF
jgi:uncharacterized protein YukE